MAKSVRVVLMLFALVGMVGGYAARYLRTDDRDRREPAEEALPVEQEGRVRAEVLRVVDGDTIVVDLDGREERVRYIGIDTPETHHPRIGEEPYGKEATEANRSLVRGRTVLLDFGAERRDHYGRLLAYVYLPDGTFVNAVLVREGHARILTVPPNVGHADELRDLERQARRDSRGLWALPGE